MLALPLLTWLTVQGNISPIGVFPDDVVYYSQANLAGRVWYSSKDDELPHIQTDRGLYISKKPNSYSLVNHVPGKYSCAAPFAMKGPNTFSVSSDKHIATIYAMDIYSNKTFWTREITLDSAPYYDDTAVSAVLDGSLVVFVHYIGRDTITRFFDGLTGEEVMIPEASNAQSFGDLGGYYLYPMKHHILMAYTIQGDSEIRCVQGATRQVIVSTAAATGSFFFSGWAFVAPSSMWLWKDEKASLIDLTTNKSTSLPGMNASDFMFSHAPEHTLAVASTDGDQEDQGNRIRLYNVTKQAFIPGKEWEVQARELMHLDGNDHLALRSVGPNQTRYLTNYLTKQSWLLDTQESQYCYAGWVVRNTNLPKAPYVVVLSSCFSAKKNKFQALVYQIPSGRD